ncbi:MAG TPA: hypothetical protein VIF38_10705 [Burkholderiales bacterium]|jgi:hypothetical protein
MSQILDKLKRAEAERQRIVAERKRLEAEADAALAAREMEERTGRAPAAIRVDAHAAPAPDAEAPWESRPRDDAAGRALAAADAETARLADERRKIERRPRAASAAGSRTRLAIGAALALCLAAGVALFRQEPKQELKPELKPGPQRAFELKLDRNLESFAQRAAGKEKR